MVNSHTRCFCGHEKMNHVGDHAPCAIIGCWCEDFNEAPIERAPRAKTIKTLDKTEPKLFSVDV